MWLVYVVRALTSQFTSTRRYVGSVQMLPGEGVAAALARRKAEHEGTLGKRGALWLKICLSPLEIWDVALSQTELTALATELWHFMARVKSGPRALQLLLRTSGLGAKPSCALSVPCAHLFYRACTTACRGA